MAVLATGVGHTVLSTFPICVCLFVCKYASWFTFTFKVAVMTIIGCDNVQYWVSLLIHRKRSRNNCMELLR